MGDSFSVQVPSFLGVSLAGEIRFDQPLWRIDDAMRSLMNHKLSCIVLHASNDPRVLEPCRGEFLEF